jgi:hypothetical protein
MTLAQNTTLLIVCTLVSGCSGPNLSEIATAATQTLNALLDAGRRGDVGAALQTFAPGRGNEAALKTLFSTRKEVFSRATPIRASDSSYSSVQGGSAFDDLFRGGTQLEARVPGVEGVSLRARVINQSGWKLTAFELFNTP